MTVCWFPPVAIPPQTSWVLLFTARELARIVQACYVLSIDHRGIRRVLELHQLSPEVLRLHYQMTQQATLPPFSTGQQLALALEPPTPAQRLLQALGPALSTWSSLGQKLRR